MKAPLFDYARPKDVAEALQLLAEGGRPAAGTQSLGPMLNLRVAHPPLLVDIRQLEELRAVSQSPEAVTLGACVTHAEIEDRRVPDPTNGFMAAIAANISYRAVRNRGTIGGSLAHADPAADWPTALAALGATALVASRRGRREVPVDSFVTGIFSTVLEADELLVAIRIPRRSARARYGYWKFCRKAGEFPEAAAALLLDAERRVARLFAGALERAPQPLDSVARAVAQEGTVHLDSISAALARVAPSMGPAARKLRATAVQRAIAQA
jgi:carbon-monoxide dehydrogenase medium subunit